MSNIGNADFQVFKDVNNKPIAFDDMVRTWAKCNVQKKLFFPFFSHDLKIIIIESRKYLDEVQFI